jgi:hypothetical protein
VWEEIVYLARSIDGAVAAHEGMDRAEVLRLAKAVVAFQRQIASRSFPTSEIDSTGGASHE